MPASLNTNVTTPAGTRLTLADFDEMRSNPSDPDSVIGVRVRLELRSAPATDRLYGAYVLRVINGESDQLRLRPAPDFVAGMPVGDVFQVVTGGVSTPTGATSLLAAFRGGNVNARKNSALAELKALDVIQQSSIPVTVP